MLPCLIFEDEHLLVVNKRAGLNTHAPSPYAGEGLYDWLRHREPRWASLAIIHRLDKETSGVIVFAKTSLANRSLTEQFTQRGVHKKYLLLTDRPMRQEQCAVKSALVRVGEKYVCRPAHAGGEFAETRFKVRSQSESPNAVSCTVLEAEPLTGKTHQIRVHAADQGFPILGDVLYGGTPAPRVFLHADEIAFKHPASGEVITFRAPADFSADDRAKVRSLIDPDSTNAFRMIHGGSDGWPGWHVERLGDYLLSQSDQPLTAPQRTELARLLNALSARGAYHKILMHQVRRTSLRDASSELVLGKPAPERFAILENGVQFELSFNEGYSIGIFLDQRDNRHRLLTGHIASGFPMFPSAGKSEIAILNTFAYTCAFSVCAARAGAHATSLDLSKKYLEWGKRNFVLNHLDAARHEFIYGDVSDWLRRLTKKSRLFDVILLDPPTFSQSKQSGVFRAERDYGKLVAAAIPLLKPSGILFASTNAADWPPEEFLACVAGSIRAARRRILQQHYVPQPPDFPISRSEPAYLKTLWMRVE